MGLWGSNDEKERRQFRFCFDFCYLNAVTIKDAYPIPRTDERLYKLGDAKFFTTLDLGFAFWQVPLRKNDREKTGFACELGLYQWKRMPFGLCNATATFQRLMAQALTRVKKKYGNLVMYYVDDMVIATPTMEDHIDRLDEVFDCVKRAGLKCKPSKCEILRDSIKYLGRMVDRHCVRPEPEAVEAVLTWKAPRTDTQLMSFLGFTNYYREFIKGYTDKVYPMQKLMRNKGMERGSTNCLREHKAGTVRSASARHAYRKGHVCSRHRRINNSHLRNTASGAGMEWNNSSPSHCIWQ